MRLDPRIEVARAHRDLVPAAGDEPFDQPQEERMSAAQRGQHAAVGGDERHGWWRLSLLLKAALCRARRRGQGLRGDASSHLVVVEAAGVAQAGEEVEEER